MDRDTRNRFKALLLDLPFWAEPRRRAAFVADIFYGHEIRNRFNADGEGDVVAGELLDLCEGYDVPTESGETPCCALLAGIREHNLAAGARAAVVADLTRRLGCGAAKPAWPDDPYPGLMAFDHWQAPIFFGRAVETRELLRRLETDQGQRFLLVTGASGSGKSSLVRAGVWATLAQGGAPDLPGSADWLITAMFPAELKGRDGSADPFRALANSLKQHPRLGWIYPGDEAEKLRSDPPPGLCRSARLASSKASHPKRSGCSSSIRWRSCSLPLAKPLASHFWTCCSRRQSFRASGSSRRSARISSRAASRTTDSTAVLNNPFGHYSVKAPGPLAMARMVSGPVAEVAARRAHRARPSARRPHGRGRGARARRTRPAGLRPEGPLRPVSRERPHGSRRLRPPELRGAQGRDPAPRGPRTRARGRGRPPPPCRGSFPVCSRSNPMAPPPAVGKTSDAGHRIPRHRRLIDEFTRKDTRLLVVGPDDNPTVEVAHEALLARVADPCSVDRRSPRGAPASRQGHGRGPNLGPRRPTRLAQMAPRAAPSRPPPARRGRSARRPGAGDRHRRLPDPGGGVAARRAALQPYGPRPSRDHRHAPVGDRRPAPGRRSRRGRGAGHPLVRDPAGRGRDRRDMAGSKSPRSGWRPTR